MNIMNYSILKYNIFFICIFIIDLGILLNKEQNDQQIYLHDGRRCNSGSISNGKGHTIFNK